MSADTESQSTEVESGTNTEWKTTESESEAPEVPCLRNWLELPRDVTASILLKLGAIEIIESAQKVCTLWRSICKDPSMWRFIDMQNTGDRDMPYCLEKMCRHAIDRSSGGLVGINIEYFGTDDLLAYIAERASQLRRLQLACCYDISDEGLSEAASKLPLLEELEIHVGNTNKDAIEAVGRCCPLLKTLKYNQQGIRNTYFRNDEKALAIAQNMPGLNHIQLIGNCLTNHGLQAILDGCPHLESLDLRKCFHVNLEGDLGKRCAQQIKNLRRPNDSTGDYKFSVEVGESGYLFDESDLIDSDYGSMYGYDDFDGYDALMVMIVS
ncbi:hypothetical protein COLO4_34054 [Corchorus olitorius]|uniref:F-box domain-containing protein n=1 Tax=Corchorus olitorius TaxID=93759 RepID=A0A1R3GNW6_9ROSI|nr:hypothetical protein COLO4_34054 [Corchorus olitorius]